MFMFSSGKIIDEKKKASNLSLIIIFLFVIVLIDGWLKRLPAIGTVISINTIFTWLLGCE